MSRIIRAARRNLYQAFLNPDALVSWLPPHGMTGCIHAFDPREGGSYRMSLTHDESDHSAPGKISEHSDFFQVRFLELIPDQLIVWQVAFESEDLAFAAR